MSIQLPPLPYGYEALEPHISANTLRFHHDKHHAKYVENANKLITGTPLENADLATIVKTAKAQGNQGLFNNAAQVWNHSFYWECMKPNGGGAPTGKVAELINSSFGSYEKFREEFESAATAAFGSAWAWLVWTPAGLTITKTSNADTPLTDESVKAILTIDVWEHAYYLDYQNLRPNYIKTFLDKLVNWEFVESQLP